MRLIATDPQMKFGIYDVPAGGRFSVKLTGEAQASAAGAEGSEGGSDQNEILSLPGPVGRNAYPLLATILAALAAGFIRLWYQQPPLSAEGPKSKVRSPKSRR